MKISKDGSCKFECMLLHSKNVITNCLSQSILAPIRPDSGASEFTILLKLAPELRLKIWAYVMANLVVDHKARVVKVLHGVDQWSIISIDTAATLPIDEKPLSPPPILVCKEFMEFADAFLDACICLRNKRTSRALKLRFNTKDIAYFKNFRHFACRHFTQDIGVEDSALSKCSIGIETLAFSEADLYPFLAGMAKNPLPAVLSQFKKLKNIYILLLVLGDPEELSQGQLASSYKQITEKELHGKILRPWSAGNFPISWIDDTLKAFSKDHTDWEMPIVRFLTTGKSLTIKDKYGRQSTVDKAWRLGW